MPTPAEDCGKRHEKQDKKDQRERERQREEVLDLYRRQMDKNCNPITEEYVREPHWRDL